MINLEVINPQEKQPYPRFTHNTTTYVGVPHGASSMLRINTSPDTRPAMIQIVSGGKEILSAPFKETSLTLSLSELKAPAPPGNLLSRLPIPIPLPFSQRKPILSVASQRLYAFTVHAFRDPGKSMLSASFEIHILCDTDWKLAYTAHQRLQKQPDALHCRSIWEYAEGTCPICKEIRKSLQAQQE